MKTANNFIADELANKVYHLSRALEQAKSIIDTLEEQNKNLIDVLNGLTSEKIEDHVMSNEVLSEHSYAM